MIKGQTSSSLSLQNHLRGVPSLEEVRDVQDTGRSSSAERDPYPSTPRQPIEVSVPDAPKLRNRTSIEQAPSLALQVCEAGCAASPQSGWVPEI